MNKAILYHAGCPICIEAEQQVIDSIDKTRFNIEIIHLGADKSQITSAEQAGVLSVPALVLNGNVFHINFGASIADVKGGA